MRRFIACRLWLLPLVVILAGCGLDLRSASFPWDSQGEATFTPVVLAQDSAPAPTTSISAEEALISPASTSPTQRLTAPRNAPLEPTEPTPTPTTLTPTEGPSPTLTRTPTKTRTATRTRAPTKTPTITLTPTPPSPANQVLRPGALSKVVSPIRAEFYAETGYDGLLTVELLGEDGRVIARQTLDFARQGRFVYAAPQIQFEIQALSELGRLQVHSEDEFGRPIAFASVDLVLLSVGRNELNALPDQFEPFIIRTPRKEANIAGGLLIIEGLARPANDSTIFIELIAESGAVLVTKQFTVDFPVGGETHTPFRVEFPYRVTQSTPVRMVIRQGGGRLPGTLLLSSRLITLEP